MRFYDVFSIKCKKIRLKEITDNQLFVLFFGFQECERIIKFFKIQTIV